MKLKYTLIASSLLAVFSAQAQTAFTVYGNADIAVNNDVKTATTGIKTEENSVVPGGLSTSNVGFRGEREISKGLKATFQMEFEVDQTTDTGIVKTRVGLVGLAGDFGAVTFGRRTTLAKATIDALDANDGANTAGFIGDNARDSRRNDMITYSTPSIAGFSADVQLGLGAPTRITSAAGVVTQDGKSEDSNGVGLNYSNGPLTIKWVNDSIKNYSKSVSVAGYSIAVPTAIATRKNEAIGATYDFGIAKLYFVDTKMKQGTDATLVKFDTQTFGVRAPVGNFTLVAEVGTGKAKLTNSDVKADADSLQLAVLYTLAKDTTLFGVYGTESIAHPTFLKKAEQTNTQFGVRYKF
jgi:predicted porin